MREQIALLLNNLHLLGVIRDDPDQDPRISCRTFTALDNHRHAAEYILYSLLGEIDPVLCEQRLAQWYPCHDSVHAKEFRNATFKWLTDLKKEGVLGPSTVRRSMLNDCAGERYEDLLVNLSSYVYKARWARKQEEIGFAYRESLQIALDSSSSLEDLNVHALIEKYRLQKLEKVKKRRMDHYRHLAAQLAEHTVPEESAASLDSLEMDLDHEEKIERELNRIERFTSVDAKRLITPKPIMLDPFFTELPWRKAIEKVSRPDHESDLAQLHRDHVVIVRRIADREELFKDRVMRLREHDAQQRLEEIERQERAQAEVEETTPAENNHELAPTREVTDTSMNDDDPEQTILKENRSDVESDMDADMHFTSMKSDVEPFSDYQVPIDLTSQDTRHPDSDKSMLNLNSEDLYKLTPVKLRPSFLPRPTNRDQKSDPASAITKKPGGPTPFDRLKAFDSLASRLPKPPSSARKSQRRTNTRSIGRLIDILNDSDSDDEQMSVVNPPARSGSGGASDEVDSSFSVWNPEGDSDPFPFVSTR